MYKYVIINLSCLPLCFSITPAEMAPFTEQLLTNLFKALALPGSAENEYIMKGTLVSCLSLKTIPIDVSEPTNHP